VPDRRLRGVPNGIPLSAFGPDPDASARIRAELGIPADAFVVGTVGRLAPEKDYPLLVRAIAPALGEAMRLVIVGDGECRERLRESIPADRAAYVTLTGMRRDVPALLAAFDLFVLSSRTEGLPLAIPEAMATGLPVVATAVGGLPGIVPRECGLLVPSGDAHALGGAIDALARDRYRARAMGRAARSHALDRFSIDRMTDAYEAIYRGD